MMPQTVRTLYWASEMRKSILQSIYITGIVIFFWGCQEDPLKIITYFPYKDNSTESLYPTISGVYAALNHLKAEHAQNVELFQVGELTIKDRPVPLVRISSLDVNNPKQYLFVAGTHGDEAIVVQAMLYSMNKISDEIANRQNNSKAFILDFIPLHNPDGYAENERTNASGIDLNRNFPYASASGVYESETSALISLINSETYDISLYFHSANEAKYNNVIRCPVEYRKKGLSVLKTSKAAEINALIDIILEATGGIESENIWSIHSDLVDAGGIASDWCVSGFIQEPADENIKIICNNPHPSLTLEMTYPKQPLDRSVIKQEKEEMFRIFHHLIERL